MSDLGIGQPLQLVATLQDAMSNALTGRMVTWSSSNASVATVDANGLVMALSLGKTVITATSEGQSIRGTRLALHPFSSVWAAFRIKFGVSVMALECSSVRD